MKILGRETTSTYTHIFNFTTVEATENFWLTNREGTPNQKISVRATVDIRRKIPKRKKNFSDCCSPGKERDFIRTFLLA